jgi:hypothetical protein
MKRILNELNWGYVILFVLMGGAIIYNVIHEPIAELTPRQKNGIDTLYTDDSAYVIKYQIIKAFEIEKEYEPAEYN